MMQTLQRPAEMSVVDRNLDLENEVMTMTTLASFERQLSVGTQRHSRPRGFDRIVMRLSLTTLLWARRRADRGVLSREQHALLLEQATARQHREHATALLTTRLG